MDLNPYQAPPDPAPVPRSRIPRVFVFAACWLVWASFGVMMVAQYQDEAAGYMPAFMMGTGGVAFVLAGMTLSSFYLWRAMTGRP